MRPYSVTLILPVREPVAQWGTDLHTDSYNPHVRCEWIPIGNRSAEEGASNLS